MSEGQEATATQPVNKQENSGQSTSISKSKKSKKNRKNAKSNAKKKAVDFEKYQDYKFPDDGKPIEVDRKRPDAPSGEPEKMAEEGAKMLDEQAGACKPDDSFMNAQSIVEGIHSDDLPSDWVKFQHVNDVTVYMHKPTRVCTLSKPYIPHKGFNTDLLEIQNATSVPRLSYKYTLDEEKRKHENDDLMFQDFNKPETYHHSETNTKRKDGETKNSNVNRTDKTKPGTSIENKVDDQLNINWSEMMAAVSETPLINAGNKAAKRKENNDFKDIVFGDHQSMELNDLLLFASKLSTVPMDMDYGKDNACYDFAGNYKTWSGAGYSGQLNSATPASQHTLFMSDNMMDYDSEDNGDDLVSAQQIAEYCKNLFKYKMAKYEQSNWAIRQKLEKEKQALQRAKLAKEQASKAFLNKDGDYKAVIEHTMLNASESGFMSMFHEFVYNVLQAEPNYTIEEIYPDIRSEDGVYRATVYINNRRFGVGRGLTMPHAKYAAGRATVPMLMSDAEQDASDVEADFFDYVSINDPSILDYTANAIAISPYAILLAYLRRNNNDNLNKTIKSIAPRRLEITMTIDHLTTTVICQNEFTAVHRASQNILQALHPDVRSWGALLCLHSLQSMEKQLEKMQSSNEDGKYNRSIEKLQLEMMKLRKRSEAAANAILMQTGHSKYFSIVESITM